MRTFSKQIPPQLHKKVIEQLLQPSATCQVCLSQKNFGPDYVITCEICRDSIHQSHYGSDLLYGAPQKWLCQRCQYVVDNKPQQKICCKYCPFTRGIMKQMSFQFKDQKEKQRIWIHPECASWEYPRNFFGEKKRQSLIRERPITQTCRFWVNQDGVKICEVCEKDYGFPLKCKYQDCRRFYHVSCGKKEGVLREMDSMKFQNSTHYVPIYCREHLEKRVIDFKAKARRANLREEYDMGQQFCKLAKIFENQLNSMNQSAKKYAIDEKMREDILLYYRRELQQQEEPIEISISQNNCTEHSESFYQFLENLRVRGQLSEQSRKGFSVNHRVMQKEVRMLRQGRSLEMMDVQKPISNQKVVQSTDKREEEKCAIPGEFQIAMDQQQ